MKQEQLIAVTLKESVLHYAAITKEAGLDGVVCSAWEAGSIHELLGHDFVTVAPGIRMESDRTEDQKRVATPEFAKQAGVTSIVVGRSITRSADPLKSYEQWMEAWKGVKPMKHEIAEKLLEIKAVALSPNQPFTWTSGLRSPIYCDNRLTLSYPYVRREIAKGLQKLILENFPEAEVIAGTATAGIPHAAWVSELMDLPMCYVRSKAKGHGKGNQIEGKVEQGQKVVVVEDLISTGGSVVTAVQALREAGCNVLGAVSIFTYGLEKGKETFVQEGIKQSIVDGFPYISGGCD